MILSRKDVGQGGGVKRGKSCPFKSTYTLVQTVKFGTVRRRGQLRGGNHFVDATMQTSLALLYALIVLVLFYCSSYCNGKCTKGTLTHISTFLEGARGMISINRSKRQCFFFFRKIVAFLGGNGGRCFGVFAPYATSA